MVARPVGVIERTIQWARRRSALANLVDTLLIALGAAVRFFPFRGQCVCGPGGVVRIDPENQHLWIVLRLGKIVKGGQFEVLVSSEEPIRPECHGASRSPAAWNAFLADLQQRRDGLWANPGR